MTEQVDFQAVHQTAMMYIDSFLAANLPGGKLEGNEYVVRNPTRPDNSPGSFKINMVKRTWSDFATGDAGGDLVSLYAYISGVSQIEAARELGAQYGGGPAAAKPERPKPSPVSTQERTTWTPILPVPDDAPEPMVAHYKFGPYKKRWAYLDRIGRVLGYACRFERINSKGEQVKDILPLTYCLGSDGQTEWRYHSIPAPRPLYALNQLTSNPKLPVLVVEGEKCAEAGNRLIGDRCVVTTHMGGSNAVKKTDWSVLSERRVIVWPDNDGAGRKALDALSGILGGLAGELLAVYPPKDAPDKWDIADAIEQGWDAVQIDVFLRTAIPVKTPGEVPVSGGEAGRAKNDYQPQPAPAHAPLVYHHTDAGAAQFLVDRYGHEIRFNARPFRSWFWYDGIRWREDLSNRVYDYVDRLVRDILDAAAKLETDQRKPLEKWAYKLESMSRQKALVAKAETLQSISVAAEDFDKHGWLFNCLNVTLDLESGEPVPRPHSAHDYITMLSPVVYDPNARCPLWEKYIDRTFDGDESLIEFMQRASGYSLTSDVSEQVLFFAYGTGANGKTVFFETLRSLLGDYGGKAPTEMLMQQQFAQVPTDVADLRGKRFVVASEVEDGKRWAEARLKDLTGGDTVKARRMREDFFEFRQTHKLWVFGNHKPVLRGTDFGIKRRLRIVPFTVQIPEEERIELTRFLAMLREELPGILNWALEGYVKWREKGLGLPEAVNTATNEYFEDNDILQQFLDECCVVLDGVNVVGKKLWEAYHGWCDSNGIRSLSSKGFYRVLQERGFTKRTGHGNKTVIDGVALEAEE